MQALYLAKRLNGVSLSGRTAGVRGNARAEQVLLETRRVSAVSDRSRGGVSRFVDDSDTASKKLRKGASSDVSAIRSEVGVGHKTKRKQRASQVSARVNQLRGSGRSRSAERRSGRGCDQTASLT